MVAPFIVGFDDSASAAAALRLTVRLAAGEGAPVVAAHVVASGGDGPEAIAESERVLARVQEPGVRLRSTASHSAAEGLREVARHERAALLAIGRTYHGPVGRALADSVADQLLRHAPCPVLVTPPGIRRAIGVVGVAFDGRAESQAALDVATGVARTLGARIVLLGVAEGSTQPAFDDAAYGSPECRALHGPVGPALEHACNDGVDLLVAGSRGYGPAAIVVAGSVSRHLAHHAPCPVLVVARHAGELFGAGRPTVSAA